MVGGGGAGGLHFIKKANLLAEAPNGTVNTIRRPDGQPDRAGLVGPVGWLVGLGRVRVGRPPSLPDGQYLT